MIDVSFVIVCMNNLKNLYPCLNSIKEYTTVSYEVLVVAYLFTDENLSKVRKDFPWVKFVESNEIRGFSENNNLALKEARGKYCFVLNDDTEMKMDVAGELYRTIENLPSEVAIISPATYYGNGELQSCGRPPHTTLTYIKGLLRIGNEQKDASPYVNQKGVFQSYDVVGAAFMIRTDVMKELGWFDERFFFCPEDVALSTKANKNGYKAYVNADVHLIHYEGMTGHSVSKVKTATAPAGMRGSLIYYSHDNLLLYALLGTLTYVITQIKWMRYSYRYKKSDDPYDWVFMTLCKNIVNSIFTRKTPKEIFIKYYSALK